MMWLSVVTAKREGTQYHVVESLNRIGFVKFAVAGTRVWPQVEWLLGKYRRPPTTGMEDAMWEFINNAMPGLYFPRTLAAKSR